MTYYHCILSQRRGETKLFIVPACLFCCCWKQCWNHMLWEWTCKPNVTHKISHNYFSYDLPPCWTLFWYVLVDLADMHSGNSELHPLQWSHNERDGASSHRRIDCLLKCVFRCWSKKTSKLRVTGLCEGNPPVTGAEGASNAENISIWWSHHAVSSLWTNIFVATWLHKTQA